MNSVNIHKLAGFTRRVTQTCYESGVSYARKAAAARARPIIREEINSTSPHKPFDRGEYLRSWRVIDILHGVRVYSTSLYASIIDRGRRPGSWSNLQALTGWVHRKLSQGSMSPSRERGVAFAVALAIKRRGTPAKWVFKRSCNRIVPLLVRAFREGVASPQTQASAR